MHSETNVWQCANCANSNSVQTMANLDLLRQGCLLFSVFLETEENTDSGQEKGQTFPYKILKYALNMLVIRIKILLFFCTQGQ